MASNPTWAGSTLKPRSADAARRRRLAAAALVFLVAGIAGADQPKLLPNERAFAFSARGVDERTVEARFVIADGYYLYRDKLHFSAEPQTLGTVALPSGKFKEDQFFGKVEIYRNQVLVKLPLDGAAPGKAVTVQAESQGCADLGVCYPPQIQKVTLTLPQAGGRPGMPVEASPPKKSWLQ